MVLGDYYYCDHYSYVSLVSCLLFLTSNERTKVAKIPLRLWSYSLANLIYYGIGYDQAFPQYFLSHTEVSPLKIIYT